jgi:hypothetical protein
VLVRTIRTSILNIESPVAVAGARVLAFAVEILNNRTQPSEAEKHVTYPLLHRVPIRAAATDASRL